MISIIFYSCILFSAIEPKSIPENSSDTITYNGLIAIEIFNNMTYLDNTTDDGINIYNSGACWGFVLFNKSVTISSYEQAFFPLLLCDPTVNINHLLEKNNIFYDSIFNPLKPGKKYQDVVYIKGEGRLTLTYIIKKVNLKYTIEGKKYLNKYMKRKTFKDESLGINSNLCKIIELKVE